MKLNLLMTIIGVVAFLIAVLFAGLKLIGWISWSWIWVISPIWITFTLMGLGLIALMTFYKIVLRDWK